MTGVQGMPVQVRGWPFHAHLQTWGRALDGWWGLLTWEQRVLALGAKEMLGIAIWKPAADLSQQQWVTSRPIPRVQLPSDRATWQQPEGWEGYFGGAWPVGDIITMPEGVELVTGPAWKKER